MALVAAYSFDTGAVVDDSGRNHPGTLFNSPTFPTGYTRRGLGCASASSQYVEVTDHADFTFSTEWTFMCWVKLTTLSAGGMEFVCKQNQWWFSADNVSYYHGFYKAAGGTVSIASLASSAAGVWVHLAGRKTSSTGPQIVINGTQNNGSVDTSGTMIDNANNVRMGSWDGGSEFLNGTLDDVRLYDEYLNDAQITALMNQPIGGIPVRSPALDFDYAR